VDIAGVEAVVHTVEPVVGAGTVVGPVVVDIDLWVAVVDIGVVDHTVGPAVAGRQVQVCMVALAVDMVSVEVEWV